MTRLVLNLKPKLALRRGRADSVKSHDMRQSGFFTDVVAFIDQNEVQLSEKLDAGLSTSWSSVSAWGIEGFIQTARLLSCRKSC
jgi:hypothetical protein